MTGTEIIVFRRQDNRVYTQMVITSSLDHMTTVSVWGAVSDTEEITIQGHEGKVTAVTFSPDVCCV
jgi:hypothetical protein